MSTTGRKIHRVRLEEHERVMLQGLVDAGRGSKERRRRAHILLLADEDRQGGARSDADIADIFGAGTATVERVRRQCTMEGLEAALQRKVQANRKPRLAGGKAEARLTMLACSKPPEGHARWSLKLLGDRLVELEIAGGISNETVRRALKKQPQALAEEMLVHSTEGECRFRLCHGGCAGGLCP